MIGSGTIADRVFASPAVAVLGVDAPAIAGSSNQIVPVARARVSLRLAPGDDPGAARQALVEHLRGHAPWGVEVTFEGSSGFEAGHGYMVDTSSPTSRAAMEALAQAYGREAIELGSGGSIPLVPMLTETFPGIEVLIWGAMDERSFIHSVNESVDLSESRAHRARRGALHHGAWVRQRARRVGWRREHPARLAAARTDPRGAYRDLLPRARTSGAGQGDARSGGASDGDHHGAGQAAEDRVDGAGAPRGDPARLDGRSGTQAAGRDLPPLGRRARRLGQLRT